MKEKLLAIKAINTASSIGIFMHVRPDGDTIGSAMALYYAFQKNGKNVRVFCEDVINERFSYIENINVVERELSRENSKSMDLLISVDCSDEERIGINGEVFSKFKNTICIDHHASCLKYANINIVNSANASTCEIVFSLLKEMKIDIDNNIALCLYTGVSTDTGNFQHDNTTSETFLIASELVKYNIPIKKLNSLLYNSYTKERIKMLSKSLASTRYFEDGKIAITTLMLKDVKDANANPADTEGFIDYAIATKGVLVACSVLEHCANTFKVSFRSKDEKINVCEIASVFGGGGHVMASGCRVNGQYEDVIDKLVKSIKDGMF